MQTSTSMRKGYYGLALGTVISFVAFLIVNQNVSDDADISSWVIVMFSAGVAITLVSYGFVMKLYVSAKNHQNAKKSSSKKVSAKSDNDDFNKKAVKASKKTVKKAKKS